MALGVDAGEAPAAESATGDDEFLVEVVAVRPCYDQPGVADDTDIAGLEDAGEGRYCAGGSACQAAPSHVGLGHEVGLDCVDAQSAS